MQIFIPSHARANIQSTIKFIPPKWLKRTQLVIHPSEYDEYSKHHLSTLLLVTNEDTYGIARTRQWIIDNAKSKYVLMFDDDMEFSKRNEEGKLRKSDLNDVDDMIKLLSIWLREDKFAHVGISPRAGNNYVKGDYTEIARMNNAYGFNISVLKKHNICFDHLKVMEDFDVTLSLLEAGYPNRVTYKYAWGQKKSGDVGGCSTYRTSGVQRQAAIQLCQRHPKSVKVVGKKTKTAWGGGIGNTRTDVCINWKIAYNPKRGTNEKARILLATSK